MGIAGACRRRRGGHRAAPRDKRSRAGRDRCRTPRRRRHARAAGECTRPPSSGDQHLARPADLHDEVGERALVGGLAGGAVGVVHRRVASGGVVRGEVGIADAGIGAAVEGAQEDAHLVQQHAGTRGLLVALVDLERRRPSAPVATHKAGHAVERVGQLEHALVADPGAAGEVEPTLAAGGGVADNGGNTILRRSSGPPHACFHERPAHGPSDFDAGPARHGTCSMRSSGQWTCNATPTRLPEHSLGHPSPKVRYQ
jgi:hypothetical protein